MWIPVWNIEPGVKNRSGILVATALETMVRRFLYIYIGPLS